MVKVLIVSDSHGLRSELLELKRRHEEAELFIHCGDSELSHDHKEIEHFTVVRGNCDYEPTFENEWVGEVAGRRFLVVHGHLHSVKSSLMKLALRAEEVNAMIICFGHTHMLGAEMVRGRLYINPGSLLLPRGRKEKTYCLLELEEDIISLRVFDFEHGEIEDLQQTFESRKFL